jgi:glycosyltransferase involved in cell wall biosynthesis
MNAGIIVDNDLVNDKRVLREIKILVEEGFKVNVLCFGFRGKKYDDLKDLSVTRIAISKKVKNLLFFFLNTFPAYEWLWISWIYRFIKCNDIDVLHVHDLYMCRPAFRGKLRSKKKIPLVIDLHENFPFAVRTYNWTKGLLRSSLSRPDLWVRKERKYLSYADRIIVLSEDFRDDLHSRYPELEPGRFVVLPNVPDLAEEFPAAGRIASIPAEKSGPVIFYFGIVAERRGIFDVIDVFSELVRENQKIVLLIIGPVDKKDKKRFDFATKELIAERKLIYIPWINVSELPAWLDFSDICIAPFHKNPQHESGVANKIYDYMLGSKPIIASDCRPQQRLIEKHDCGLIFRNRNDLKEAILRLINDRDLREKMGMNGYTAVKELYNWSKTRHNLVSLYKDLCF